MSEAKEYLEKLTIELEQAQEAKDEDHQREVMVAMMDYHDKVAAAERGARDIKQKLEALLLDGIAVQKEEGVENHVIGDHIVKVTRKLNRKPINANVDQILTMVQEGSADFSREEFSEIFTPTWKMDSRAYKKLVDGTGLKKATEWAITTQQAKPSISWSAAKKGDDE